MSHFNKSQQLGVQRQTYQLFQIIFLNVNFLRIRFDTIDQFFQSGVDVSETIKYIQTKKN